MDSWSDLQARAFPLQPTQFFYLCSCVANATVDISRPALCVMLADHLNSTFQLQPPLTPAFVRCIIDAVQRKQPALFEPIKVPADLRLAAAPTVNACLECGGPLETYEVKPRPFFYCTFEPGEKGTLYNKSCGLCALQYDLHGFESTAVPTAERFQMAYPAAHDHPNWFKLSQESVVSRRLLQAYEASIYHLNASFVGFAEGNNTMSGAEEQLQALAGEALDCGAPLSFSNLRHGHRFALTYKVLEKAFLRSMFIKIMREESPSQLSTFNLRAQLDSLLQEAHTPVWMGLSQRFHEHLAAGGLSHLCGRVFVLDGHAKVCRSVCANTALPSVDAATGEAIMVHCEATPAPSCNGYCAQCYSQLPPSKKRKASQMEVEPPGQQAGLPSGELGEAASSQPQQQQHPYALGSQQALAASGGAPVRRSLRVQRLAEEEGSFSYTDLGGHLYRAESVLDSRWAKGGCEYFVKYRNQPPTVGHWLPAAVVPPSLISAYVRSKQPTDLSFGYDLYRGPEAEDPVVQLSTDAACLLAASIAAAQRDEQGSGGTLPPPGQVPAATQPNSQPPCEPRGSEQPAVLPALASVLQAAALLPEQGQPASGQGGGGESCGEESLPPVAGAPSPIGAGGGSSSGAGAAHQAARTAAAAAPKQKKAGLGLAGCNPRKESADSCRTAGAVYGFCTGCGMMAPPLEMVRPESTTQVLNYLLRLFEHHPFLNHDEMAVVFDDMCHLARFAANAERVAASAKCKEFVEKVAKAVDFFHFKNHTGAWCLQNVNPHKIPLLAKNEANLSVCEQRFSWMRHFKYSFRYMNKARFNFMLLIICWLDGRYRAAEAARRARMEDMRSK